MTDHGTPPPTMNLFTDDNASMMEAFMTTSDLSSSWAPAPPPPPPPPQSAAAALTQDSLQQRLQAIIDGARQSWTYAIFWLSSYDYSGTSVLGWGDGYYKGDDGKSHKNSNPTSTADREHRKRVLRELNSLISGASSSSADETASVEEEITDTEWFFLISMTQSFVNGAGLPGQAFNTSSPIWIAGCDKLAASPCERARQGQIFGIQTLVCFPTENGVIEFGSTELLFESADLMKLLFNFSVTGRGGTATTTGMGSSPSSVWVSHELSSTNNKAAEAKGSTATTSSYHNSSNKFESQNTNTSSLTHNLFTKELNYN